MERTESRRIIEDGAAGQVFPAELDLFQIPPLTASYSAENYIDYRPNSVLTGNGPIEYVIPPSITQLTDLKASRHHIKVRLVQEDGGAIDPAQEIVGPINWPVVTFFEQFQLYLNQVLVTISGGQHHGYRGIIEALLDRHRFEKETSLQAGLFHKDTSGKMNRTTEEDTGFAFRWQYLGTSSPMWLSGPLITDLAQQERLILNSVELVMKFWPARPAFALMSEEANPKYRFEITDSFIRLKRKTPQASVLLGLTEGLKHSPAVYPLMRTEVRQFVIQSGTYTFNYEGLFEGYVPSMMVVAFVKATAAVGRYDENPMNFLTANLQDLSVTLDDQTSMEPIMKFRFDQLGFSRSDYLDGFESLYREAGDDIGEQASSYSSITRRDYAQGYCLMVFRFNSSANQRWLPVQSRANVKLRGSFSEAPGENLQMIVYSRFPAMLSIDETRRVSY